MLYFVDSLPSRRLRHDYSRNASTGVVSEIRPKPRHLLWLGPDDLEVAATLVHTKGAARGDIRGAQASTGSTKGSYARAGWSWNHAPHSGGSLLLEARRLGEAEGLLFSRAIDIQPATCSDRMIWRLQSWSTYWVRVVCTRSRGDGDGIVHQASTTV